MEPDDLLCSRNARSRTPLVGRAQSRIDQATLENEIVDNSRRRRLGSGQVPFLLAERARWECARSMRAVKGSLGHSLLREMCIEHFSLGLLSFSILLTFDQQF